MAGRMEMLAAHYMAGPAAAGSHGTGRIGKELGADAEVEAGTVAEAKRSRRRAGGEMTTRKRSWRPEVEMAGCSVVPYDWVAAVGSGWEEIA